MTSTAKTHQPAQNDDYDDFDVFLSDQAADPTFVAAYEDAAQRARLVTDLVNCRKAQKIKQRQIADHMEVGQSMVSEFETSSTDAYFSTLQRYARAVGARLSVRIEMPADQTWASHVRASYAHRTVAKVDSTEVRPPKSDWIQTWASEVEQRDKAAA